MIRPPVPKDRGLSRQKIFILRIIIKNPLYLGFRLRTINRRLRLIEDFGKVVMDRKVKIKNKLINMVLFKRLQKRNKKKKKYYQRKMLENVK